MGKLESVECIEHHHLDQHNASSENTHITANTPSSSNHDNQHLPLLQALHRYPRILLFTLAASTAGMTFGYDQIVNGASISMPSFLLYFGAVDPTTQSAYLPSIWTSLWTAMSALMQVVGSICAAPISDRVGRKWTIVGFCGVSAGGVAVQFTSFTRGMLLAGKMVNGCAIGGMLAVGTAWASEIAPVSLRGAVQSSIVLWTVLMQALGLVVIRQNVGTVEEKGFRTVFAIQWAFCALTAVLFLVVPESPSWLILKGKFERARGSMRWLYGERLADEEYEGLVRSIREEQEAEMASGIGGYLELYQGSNLKRTMTVHLMFFGIGLAGSSFLAQSIYFLIIAGLPAIHAYDVSCGGFALAFFTIIGSWWFLEKLGRRTLWLVGCIGNIIGMMVIGALDYSPASGALWAVAILMNVLVCWQNTLLTSIAFIVAGEISAYRLRSKNQSIAVLSNAFTTWLFNFVVPYMYNVDSGNLGARTGFVFGGATVLLLVLSWLYVPDLHGFTTTQVDWLYHQKVKVAEFQKYRDGGIPSSATDEKLDQEEV